MASRNNEPVRRPAPRLYLVTPPVAATADIAAQLKDAFTAGDVAAVLLRLADGDERTLINRAKALAPLVQDAGAALLIAGRPDIATRAGADGAHVRSVAALKDALSMLKPERIVGAGGLKSRDDAMTAGEAGADYVMFGEPDAHGQRPAFEAVRDRVEWWAEIFEIPCVASAERFDHMSELCAAGADFISVSGLIFDDPRGIAAAMADAIAQLKLPEATG